MKRLCLSLLVVGAVFFLYTGGVFAQYSSTNYSSNEVFFGSGGDNDQSSSNYKAQTSVGALGVGNYSSTNYQAFSGFLTPNEPFLELGLDTSTVDLGTLDTASTKTGTAAFHVRAYVDSGYTVQVIGQPPISTGSHPHTLLAMSSRGSSTTNTEQFGINLVANTLPVSFGADPSNQPDNAFANGAANSNYGMANRYKYVSGDTIAGSSGNGWGLTNYTISYIANIGIATPAGSYTMTQSLVAVATY